MLRNFCKLPLRVVFLKYGRVSAACTYPIAGNTADIEDQKPRYWETTSWGSTRPESPPPSICHNCATGYSHIRGRNAAATTSGLGFPQRRQTLLQLPASLDCRPYVWTQDLVFAGNLQIYPFWVLHQQHRNPEQQCGRSMYPCLCFVSSQGQQLSL